MDIKDKLVDQTGNTQIRQLTMFMKTMTIKFATKLCIPTPISITEHMHKLSIICYKKRKKKLDWSNNKQSAKPIIKFDFMKHKNVKILTDICTHVLQKSIIYH